MRYRFIAPLVGLVLCLSFLSACSDTDLPTNTDIEPRKVGTTAQHLFGTWQGQFRSIAYYGTDTAQTWRKCDITIYLHSDGFFERTTPCASLFPVGYGHWIATSESLYLHPGHVYPALWDPAFFVDGPYQIIEQTGRHLLLRRIINGRDAFEIEVKRVSRSVHRLGGAFAGRP